MRWWIRVGLEKGQFERRLILVGAAEDTQALSRELTRDRHGIRVLAELDVNESSVDRLVEILHEQSANGVVLAARHTFFGQLETTRDWELRRYAAVLHLRTPAADFYDTTNPLRIESAREAAALDEKIAWAWRGHAHRVVIDAAATFDEKLAAALAVVRAELPACCLAIPGQRPECDHCEEN